ncbi:MAG: hypothetical protein M3R45_11120 [Pseudomonadota bacterium]|nr:hypothetical protein [Pseudomonadota bacterium]
MSKSKPTPITREAVTRITKATIPQHGGQIPGASFISRIDAEVQKEAASSLSDFKRLIYIGFLL